MDLELKPLNREKLHFQVAKEIEQIIVKNGLKKGSALPSEKQIAEGLGIGRSSVREGIRLLEGMGVVCVQPGKGIFVDNKEATTIRLQVAIERQSLLDVLDVREVLEVRAYKLAIKNDSAEDRAAVESAFRALAEKCRPGQVVESEDMDFHIALYRASRNIFLIGMLENIMRVFFHVWDKPYGINEAFHDTFPLHEALYRGVRDRREDVIDDVVREIIDHSRNLIEERFSGDG